jgi:sugar phosphate isomerase/epimerase
MPITEQKRKEMKLAKLISSVALAAMLAGCCSMCCDCQCSSAEQPNISVFAHYIRNTAKQQGITLAEAADKLYDLGVRGFDVGPDDKDLPELAATKLKPINFYFFPKMLGADNGAADCKRCLDQAVKYGVPRVMVVPSHFTKGGDEEAEFAKDLSSMKMFVAEAKKRGITITVEDFGGPQNPGSHMKYLKRFLDEIPDLKFALDSGNLYYAGRGEDILEMMEYAKDRIAHVHLKDQTPENNRKYATLGLGAVPNEKIVKTMAASGYKGWYTLENTVGDAYTDSIRQVAVLKYWLKTATK